MARLAIVISAIGSTESLEGTLVSVLENRPADSEILVALNKPYSDPYHLQGEVRFVQSDSASPIRGINQALAATRAPFVHLLASGCQVSEGWTDEPLSRFGDRQLGSVVPLVLDAGNHERIFSVGLGYRRGGRRFLVGHGRTEIAADEKAVVIGPCGIAAFYRRAALDAAGGLCDRLGHRQADVDLALALQAAGFATVVESRSKVFATAEVERASGALQTALGDERLFWRNLRAEGRMGSMTSHAGIVAVELIRSFPRPRMFAQFAGRLLGCCQLSGRRAATPALGRLAKPSATKLATDRLRVDRPHNGQPITEPSQSRARSA